MKYFSRDVTIEFFPGFPHSSVSKESSCNEGDTGLIPGLGRSTEEGNVNPLQYSCLENPIGRGAWRATVHGVAKSVTGLKRLSMHAGNPIIFKLQVQHTIG